MLTAGNAHALTWILSTASAMDLERRRVSPQLQTRKKSRVSLADLMPLHERAAVLYAVLTQCRKIDCEGITRE